MPRQYALFNGVERLFQVVEYIVDVLGAYRKAHGGRGDSARFKPLFVELGMGGRRGVNYERFYVGNVGKQ